MAQLNDLIVNGSARFLNDIYANTFIGNASTASALLRHTKLDTATALDNFKGGELRYAQCGNSVAGSYDDGLIITIPWSANYGHQLYFNDNGYAIGHRYLNNGSWSSWKNIIDENGGTLTGALVLKGTAGQQMLRTRGIVGLNSDATAQDALYLQYGNTTNDTVYFGNANGGSISSNGTQYSGNAATATKLGSSTVGGTTTPIYLNAGTPTALSYTIAKSVPSDAKFTDTTYSAGTGLSLSSTTFSVNNSGISPYEANLQWGGKNFTGSFGCLDAAMVDELGANRFMFTKAAGITIEYTRNAGSTWTDYGATDVQKVSLFSNGNSFYIGKADSTNKATANGNKYQLRITIDTGAAGIYTVLNKFILYISTNGSASSTVTIQKALQSTPTTYTDVATDVSLSGWSGYNVINVSAFTTYGNTAATQNGRVRFIFKANGGDTNYVGLSVAKIMGFGGVGWYTPSTMAKTGHLYAFDSSQNAIFPANLKINDGTNQVGYLTATPTSGQIMIADGTAGGIKASGYTIATSVPANAVFTDSSGNNKLPLAGGTMNNGAQIVAKTNDTSSSSVYNGGVQLREHNAGGGSIEATIYNAPGLTFHWSGKWAAKLSLFTDGHLYLNSTPMAMFTQTAPTSGQVVITDGTTGGVKASGYTIATSVPSNAVFTDTNNAVTQTATTGSAEYECLFSVTADNTTRTEGARKSDKLKFNPSTGRLSITPPAANTAFPSGGIAIHDTRNIAQTPAAITEKGVNFFFSNNTMPSSAWWAGMHVHGWVSGYNAWEIVGPATTSDSRTTPLYVRTSNASSAWGSWRKIYDASNPPTASEVGALASTVKYAGASTAGGAATSAAKLTNTSKIGDTNKPVYFSANGVPVAISYTIEKSVPSNAVFTDTTYSTVNATYTLTKSSGTWTAGTVTAKRFGNVVHIAIGVKGTGTAVSALSPGFVGKIAASTNAALPALATNLIAHYNGIPIICSLDTSGNVTFTVGYERTTIPNNTEVKVYGTFIVA